MAFGESDGCCPGGLPAAGAMLFGMLETPGTGLLAGLLETMALGPGAFLVAFMYKPSDFSES